MRQPQREMPMQRDNPSDELDGPVAFAETRTPLASIRNGTEQGIILLGPGARFRFATPHAQRLVEEFFSYELQPRKQLPEILARWLRQHRNRTGPPTSRMPLVIGTKAKKLFIRLCCLGESRMLLLEKRLTQREQLPLESLGLSGREAEVLTWIAQGKSNADIALILSISPRTVQKHLEHIFQKLGTETRTAAAAIVWKAPR